MASWSHRLTFTQSESVRITFVPQVSDEWDGGVVELAIEVT
jgi:hypothetical protein